MTGFFTALWPPRVAVAALAGELAAHPDWPPDGWRPVPTGLWCIPLRSHGEGEPGLLARRLDAGACGLLAPCLRLVGAVSLPGVAAVGVGTAGQADAAALRALTEVTGADPGEPPPHLAVARTARRHDAPPPAGPLGAHRGPWWRPADVRLVYAEPGPAAPRYRVLHRVPLRVPAAAQ
jgi:2'-5' RNA ligase